jgi:hypothetical protein
MSVIAASPTKPGSEGHIKLADKVMSPLTKLFANHRMSLRAATTTRVRVVPRTGRGSLVLAGGRSAAKDMEQEQLTLPLRLIQPELPLSRGVVSVMAILVNSPPPFNRPPLSPPLVTS